MAQDPHRPEDTKSRKDTLRDIMLQMYERSRREHGIYESFDTLATFVLTYKLADLCTSLLTGEAAKQIVEVLTAKEIPVFIDQLTCAGWHKFHPDGCACPCRICGKTQEQYKQA